MAKEAGFDVNKEDWLKHQATQTLELSDEELENVSAGKVPMTKMGCY
jgi:predicted ribosomally synthesized peptide with nif11-like leader